MEQLPQSSGQTQNVPIQKEWYKKWWGVILVLCIWPFFAIWYIWRKTAWSKKTKWVATAVVVLLFIWAQTILSDSKEKAQENNTSQATEQIPSEETVKLSFDIPALFGKDIDQIREVLGKPTDLHVEYPENVLKNKEALGQDISLETWSNRFESNEMYMSVEFYIKTRAVKEFFVEANDPSGATTDKQRLMNIGNVKENDPRYVLDFVEARNSPGEYTGLIITKK